MKKNKKHFQPQFDFNALISDDHPGFLKTLSATDPVKAVFVHTSSSASTGQIIYDTKDIKTESKNHKKSKPKRVEPETIFVSNQETKVINSNGDTTVIVYETVTVHDVLNYVVKVRREYADGGVYVEPDHFWQSLQSCKIDMKDWEALGRKCDW